MAKETLADQLRRENEWELVLYVQCSRLFDASISAHQCVRPLNHPHAQERCACLDVCAIGHLCEGELTVAERALDVCRARVGASDREAR